MRVATVNAFFVSLFSFVNRFFFMPQDVLQSIENRILLFLSRVSFTRLGLFAHLRDLYGINAEIRDLRLANLAAVLSTYIHNPRNVHYLHLSLTRIQRMHPARRFGRPATHLEHPACSWLSARAYFIERVQETPDEVYERALPSPERRAEIDLPLPSIQRILYSSLRQNERPMWSRYLRNRIHDRGWNSALFMQGFQKCPRATTQAQRWHLFRIHFNGHMSSTRVHAALPSVAVLPCPLCGGTDSASHLLECPTTRAAFDFAADALPLGAAYHGSWSELFFQSPLADAAFTFTLALFSAAWSCRGAVLRGQHCRGAPPAVHQTHLAACIARGLEHPGLLSGSSATQAERRLARIQPPTEIPPDADLAQSDGGYGLSAAHVMTGVWGAAWWSAGRDRSLPPSATAAGVCPQPSSNNIAEFFGFRASLRRALR